MNLRALAAWLPWSRKSDGAALSAAALGRALALGSRSKAGVPVTWETALRVSTVLACARVIADGLAQVPLKLYQDDGTNKLPAVDHPLYGVLYRRPNEWQTSFEFRETMALHLVLTGRFIAFKNVVRGTVAELIPFEPGTVTVKAPDVLGGPLSYEVRGRGGVRKVYPAEAVWHIKGPSWTGWDGLDAVQLAREAIGLAIAAEDTQASLHANGLAPSGTYAVEGTLTAQQYNDLRKFITENYTGAARGMPMILDRNAKWLNQSLSGVDAQHIETRRHQITEICAALRVMPIMIGYSDKAATYASAEQMFLAHVVHTLSPWYQRVEQSIDVHLLTEADRAAGMYARFVTQGLLRGAMKDRSEYLAKALGAGGSPAWMTQDEVRALEELNPLGGSAAALPVATNVQASGQPPA